MNTANSSIHYKGAVQPKVSKKTAILLLGALAAVALVLLIVH
jgi:hypothetical protein